MAGAYGFFGALRHLAVKVDNETHKLKEKMTGERQKNKPEDATLLLLELQNEMKSLHESVNKTLLGMKKNDGHFMELVPLCQTVVVQHAEKLSKVEEYIGKYGYVAPDVQPSRLANASNDDSPADVNENNSDDVEQISNESQCSENVKDKTGSPVELQQGSSLMCTPKSQVGRSSNSSEDRTPQPEDFGISLANIMRKYKDERKDHGESCFKMPHIRTIPHHVNGQVSSGTPQNFQHKGLCVTPGLLGRNIPVATPTDGAYIAHDRQTYSFDHEVPSLKLNCDSDNSPETPTFRTPSLHDRFKRNDCHYGQEDDTIALLMEGKKPPQHPRVNSVNENDDWDSSPVPPVLTSGVLQFPKKDTAVQKLQLNDGNTTYDNSPIAPVLVTPAAKKFQKRLQEQNTAECGSEDNSPAVPVFVTPGIDISRHKSTLVTTKSVPRCIEEKCEENSPQFPALQSMAEDISKLELPKKPVLSSNSLPSDFDIPEPPELTTNLQALTAHLNFQSELNCQSTSTRKAFSTLQSVGDVTKVREPKFFTSEKFDTDTDVTQMKENLHIPQELTEHIPEKLKGLSAEEYATLSTYTTRQLSMEAIDSMIIKLNKILAKKVKAGEAEEIFGADLQKYLGDKTKMFILVMRQLGKLQVKGNAQNPTYILP